MRIVMLTTNMAVGGAEAQVAQLSLALRGRGYEVSVVSLVQPSAWQHELRTAGVRLLAPGVARLAGVLRELRPQILHCHMFHGNIAGRLLGLICPETAVVSTIHSMAEIGQGSTDVSGRDAAYRWTDRLAAATVAVSESVAERHLSARVSRRIRVIPNGVDTSRFGRAEGLRERVRSELQVGTDFVWLAAGRLMWKKDYPTMLRAFSALGSGTLLIAGEGPEEAVLRSLAGPGVRFLGLRADLADLMAAADGFVLSSVVEGLPLVLLEAGASGLTCVATNAGGVAETGIPLEVVSPGDVRALAAAMCKVMDLSVSERERIGEESRRRVSARYDIGTITDAWEALYRELAGRG